MLQRIHLIYSCQVSCSVFHGFAPTILDMFGQALVADVRGVALLAGEGPLARVDPLVGGQPTLVSEFPVVR